MNDKLLEIKSTDIEKTKHTSSILQPDTLFHFMDQVDWLIDILMKKYIYARYCKENIKYLEITGIETVAIPMRCFCDIKLHELQMHTKFYGANGIAFPKAWGMDRGIQPLHYLNPNSKLREEYTNIFNNAIINVENQTETEELLENFMAHQMIYYKPYSGTVTNRETEEEEQKCFMDEHEWRFIADVSVLDYPTVIPNPESNSKYIKTLTESLSMYHEIALEFEYDDIKYLIVEDETAFFKLTKAINKLKITKNQKTVLISKIIIWDKAKGDF